jgi:L-fucose isomerase-like protein
VLLKIGFVTVASVYEAGVDESESWMDSAIMNLQKKNVEVIAAKPVLTNQSNLKKVLDQLKTENIDLLVIMNGTWAADSLQFELIKNTGKLALLWALPYPKTYSLASVLHLGSILKELDIYFKYVYGAPDDEQALSQVVKTAEIAQLANLWNIMRVGKVGRRFTWRTMGPTDITYDELDLELHSGPSALHIDVDELFSITSKIPDEKAKDFINHMNEKGKLGTVEANERALIEATKVYFAIKRLIKKYNLDALTVECYPNYGGIDNLASAWLAEEGIVSVCEGDLGHTALWLVLQKLTNKPVGLLEPVQIIDEENALILRHEGSGAPSLSEDFSQIRLKQATEEGGVIIFSAVKPETVTLATVWGRREQYKMCISKAKTMKLTQDDVDRYGGGLVAKLKFNANVKAIINRLMNLGMDHHVILGFGDLIDELTEFCKMVRIEPIIGFG